MNPSGQAPVALFFGSIGTLVETSDLQRRAFNAAFREAGLDWEWAREDYTRLLTRPGGRARIEREAERRGENVNAALLHHRKSQIFAEMVATLDLPLRPGVADALDRARSLGVYVGLVSTTSPVTIDTLLASSRPPLSRDTFDMVLSAADVACPKPSPEVWVKALTRLGIEASQAIAVEDSPENVSTAMRAGLTTVALPGAFHRGRDFPETCETVERLSDDVLGLRPLTPPALHGSGV